MSTETHSDDTRIEQLRPLVDLGDLVAALQQGRDRKPDIVEADATLTKEYADELAFMAEWVTIRLEPGSDDNAPTVFQGWVNGRCEMLVNNQPAQVLALPIGEEITVRRSMLEVIARNKRMGVRTEHTAENRMLQLANRTIRTISQVQPVSIVEDKNPRGRPWFQEMIRRQF